MRDRREMLEDAARRGKYAPLYNHLKKIRSKEWHATFAEIEALLGFALPSSARIHRPWWANQGAGGNHSHALAWEMAGWRTAEVDMPSERLIFVRDEQG